MFIHPSSVKGFWFSCCSRVFCNDSSAVSNLIKELNLKSKEFCFLGFPMVSMATKIIFPFTFTCLYLSFTFNNIIIYLGHLWPLIIGSIQSEGENKQTTIGKSRNAIYVYSIIIQAIQ